MASYYVVSIVSNPTDHEFNQSATTAGKICVCCSSQTAPLIDIKTCNHTTFLRSIKCINQLLFELQDTHVCVLCHNLLKKIDVFQKQVIETFSQLTDKTRTPTTKKLHNFQRSPLHCTDSTQPLIEIKRELVEIEVENLNTDFEVENVKIEHVDDDSDSEAVEREAPAKKRKKVRHVNNYEGKIKVVMLSSEELKEEREAMAKQPKYVRLPYKCADCITAFDHEITWKTHMEQRHTMNKNSYQCSICKSVLNSKNAYNVHEKRHMRRLECVECGKRYNHTQSAIQHYDEKHLPAGSSLQRGYTCPDCGYTTTVNRTYRYHMEKHKQKQECDICGNTFATVHSLRSHMFSVHKQSSREYRCEPCAKTYRAKSGLMAHLASRAHADAPRAYCAPCRAHYASPRALQVHLATHSRHVSDTDKRYICDECGAKFVKKCSLKAHINWEHLKIYKHRCPKCTKVFKSASAMRHHVSFVHNKQRPPRNKICHYCGRGFTTQTILQSHLRTHTGERPLQCQHCRATFAHSGALYTHMKLKHAALNK